jgi:hypothetical protein
MNDLDQCWFYHTYEFPELGLVPGNWDLRGKENEYLGNINPADKTILDVGTASGYLTYHLMSRGASVTAFDIDPATATPDFVPFGSPESQARLITESREFYSKLNNSFRFAGRILGYSPQLVLGNIYKLQDLVQTNQISIVGAILVHLRDPFQALANVASRTSETIVVVERYYETTEYHALLSAGQKRPEPILKHEYLKRAYRKLGKLLFGRDLLDPDQNRYIGNVAGLMFLPNAKDVDFPQRLNSWFAFSPLSLERMLGVLGFEDITITYHNQRYLDGTEPRMMTLVANRTSAGNLRHS